MRRASDDELPEAPPGGRVLHVEYCPAPREGLQRSFRSFRSFRRGMDCKFLPNYLKFRKALADRFGERVQCFGNHEELRSLIKSFITFRLFSRASSEEETLQKLCGQKKGSGSAFASLCISLPGLGAFEVVDVKTRNVLYTKLGSGLHITERQEWMEKLFDEVEALCAQD